MLSPHRRLSRGLSLARPLWLRKNALRAEGEKLVQRVRKFVEVESRRIGHALTAAVLSQASTGATWKPDRSFSVADAILAVSAESCFAGRLCNRSRAEGEGKMNDLEPHTERSQWLWFWATLLAMTVISFVVSFPR